MGGTNRAGDLDTRFSSPGAEPTDWAVARERLAEAGIYWLSTVRPEGGPHVTPLMAVWVDDAPHFCTGPDEQKARNLAGNRRCALVTGCNAVERGLDLVVEGEAVLVTDDERLRRLARAWEEKYGEDWRFEVRDGAFAHTAGVAHVFRVAPRTAFGFGRGEEYSQTRWRLGR